MTESMTIAIQGDASSLVAAMNQAKQAAADAAERSRTSWDKAKQGFEQLDRKSKDAEKSMRSLSGVLGQTAGKASEVVGGLFDIGSLLSSGGGLMIGVTAAVAAFSTFNKYLAEQEAILRKQEDAWDSYAAKVQDASNRARMVQMSAAARVAAFEDEQRAAFFERTGQIKFANEARAEAAIKAIRAEDDERQRSANIDGERIKAAIALAEKRGESTDALDREFAALASIRRSERAAVDAQIAAEKKLAELRTGFDLGQKMSAKSSGKDKQDKGTWDIAKPREVDAASSVDVFGGMFGVQTAAMNALQETERRIAAEREQAGIDELNRALELDAKRVASRIDAANEITRIEREFAEARAAEAAAINQQNLDQMAQGAIQYSQGVMSTGIGAIQTLVNASAQGNADAAQLAASQFMAGIGSQLVSLGTQQIFQGLGWSANPLTPGAGVPLVAIGTAAVAAGIGMGAAGAAMAPKSAPGGGAGSGSDRARTDRGVNDRRRGGSSESGDGGGVTIVNNYGLGVPREKVAGDLQSQQEFARRRSGRPIMKPRGAA